MEVSANGIELHDIKCLNVMFDMFIYKSKYARKLPDKIKYLSILF